MAPADAGAVAESSWQTYVAGAQQTTAVPFRLSMSARFGTEGDTRRVTALLWGNGDGRLRMDVMAGVGVLAASYMEADDIALVLDPREGKAYVHHGSLKPRLRMAFPLPFDLGHLAQLLTGHYAAAFGTELAQAPSGEDKGRYRLEGNPGGWLTLDAQGLPIAWRQEDSEGWRMEIAYDDAVPPLPRRLSLNHGKGGRAILLVKEREAVATFGDEQMKLRLPPGVQLLPMPKGTS